MPNHITNKITASMEVIESLTRFHEEGEKAALRDENERVRKNYKERTGNDWPYAEEDERKIEARFVDFELLVPSPPNKEVGGCSGQHEPGVVCWYSWNIENWGTKWGGYDTQPLVVHEDGRVTLTFDTAWSHPVPIIQALADKFPNERIEVEYADEDLGSNCGRYRIEGGEVHDLYQPDYGPESLELASQIKYGMSYADVRREIYEEDDEDAEEGAGV